MILSAPATGGWAVIEKRSSKGVSDVATKKGKGTKKSGNNGAKKAGAGKRKLASKKTGGGRPKDWGGGRPKGWPWEEDPTGGGEAPPLIPPGDGGLGGY